ncbi:hypothetical protein ACFX1Q_000768 [Malus domestica]
MYRNKGVFDPSDGVLLFSVVAGSAGSSLFLLKDGTACPFCFLGMACHSCLLGAALPVDLMFSGRASGNVSSSM